MVTPNSALWQTLPPEREVTDSNLCANSSQKQCTPDITKSL
jgi:hypothetical protein